MDSVPCKQNVEKMIFQEKLYILLPDKRYPPAEAKKSNEAQTEVANSIRNGQTTSFGNIVRWGKLEYVETVGKLNGITGKIS